MPFWKRKWQPTLVFLPVNPRDRGAWWAAVCGVVQSRTWLKRLSSSSSSMPFGPSSQSYGFLVVMYGCELDHKESSTLKHWCLWTVVLEKTLESPLDYKEIQSVNPKGNQSWIFIGRTDAEAEAPKLWPHDMKNWLIWKDPDGGKVWRQEEKGMMEDEMVGWHHRLYGHEFEQAPGYGDGQGGLAGCSPWDRKVRHDWATELNWVCHHFKFQSSSIVIFS